jgi:transcriptional regulator with XRE-family HTH domain
MQGWEIRERRRLSGLTALQVARAIGTRETNVAAYERGDKTPSPATLARLMPAIDLGPTSAIFVNRLLTVPAAAAAIRKGVRAGWATRDLLRIVRESRANAKWVIDADELQVYLAAPSTTGDRRWDALLAGSTENLALQRRMSVPKWTRGHALPTLWFVGESRFFDAYALAHSPASLKIRGVMVDPADLESV